MALLPFANKPGTGGGGSTTWGSITGTLSSQTDLQTALNAKLTASNNLSDVANAITARTNLLAQDKVFYTVGRNTTDDYYCDGTADDVQIQQALNDCNAAGGGTVHIKAGTYDISASLTFYSNMVIEGEGWVTKLKMSNAANLTGIFIGNSRSNTVFRNMELDGNGDNQTGPTIASLISSSLSSYLTFENLYVHDCVRQGIYLGGATACTWFKCKATNNGRLLSTRLEGFGFGCNDSSGTLPKDNRFIGCYSSGNAEGGISIFGSDSSHRPFNNTVDSCVTDNDSIGVNLWNAEDCTVTGSTFYNCSINSQSAGGYGVSIVGATKCVVSSNVINTTTGDGIHFGGTATRNDIVGNTVTLAGNVGINVDTCEFNTITSNHVTLSTNEGIIIKNSGDCKVISNYCDRNGKDGIKIWHASSNIVSGNHCYNNSQNSIGANYGIWLASLSGGGSGGATKNIASGNICIDNQASYSLATLTATASAGQPVVLVADTSIFWKNQKVTLTDGATTENAVISSIDSATQITLTANLTNTYTTAGNIKGRTSQRYGIYEDTANCDFNQILGNICINNANGSIVTAGANTKVSHNYTAATIELHPGFQATGQIDDNSQGIINVPDPTNAQDAATKHYVDTKTTRAATLIVAASNSKDTTHADYVCTGTGDQSTINTAIAALPSSGGRVLLMDGTYNITGSITIGVVRTVLQGQGWGTILNVANSTNADIISFSPPGGTYLDNVVIRDLQIQANGANQTAGYAINGFGAVWCRFQNLWIHQPYAYGIYLHQDNLGGYGHHNVIEDCLIDDGVHSASGVGGAILLDQADENMVVHNTFQANGRSGASPSLHVYDKAGLNTFLENQFVTGTEGLKLQGGHNTAIGNTFDGCSSFGIELNGDKNLVQGNKLYGVGFGGTNVSQIMVNNSQFNSIIGNLCYPDTGGNTKYGIDLGTFTANNTLVVDNVLTTDGTTAKFSGGTINAGSGVGNVFFNNKGYSDSNIIGRLTQVGLQSPTNQTFTSGTGTLTAGTYYYRVTAFDSAGRETLPSTETSLTLGATGGVNVNWTEVGGASGYKVYGRSTGAELLIATINDPTTTTYLDNGSVTPSGGMPGTNNTGDIYLQTDGNGNIGIGTTSPSEKLELLGNLRVTRTDNSRNYRFRTTGGALDFEGAGAGLYLSMWSGAGFTGTQYNQMVFDNNGASISVQRGMNLAAGTASAGTSPLKFQSGTNLSTPENGAMEYNGTHLYFTTGGTRYQIDQQTAAGSGITRSINSISTSQTAGAASSTDYVYLVSGTTTLTLPTAVGNTNRYTIKNVGTGTVTIATTSSQTIDGSASATISVQYVSIDVVSDGSNWNVM